MHGIGIREIYVDRLYWRVGSGSRGASDHMGLGMGCEDRSIKVRWILDALSGGSRELSSMLGQEFIGMILFGSWARGEAEEDSDVDVFVVLRSVGGMTLRSRIYKVLSSFVRRPITLLDMRLDRLLDEDLELTPLLINVVADGIVVWDHEGILQGFLEKGRMLIEKAKLVRYRTPDGKYGWMRSDGEPIAPTRL